MNQIEPEQAQAGRGTHRGPQ